MSFNACNDETSNYSKPVADPGFPVGGGGGAPTVGGGAPTSDAYTFRQKRM